VRNQPTVASAANADVVWLQPAFRGRPVAAAANARVLALVPAYNPAPDELAATLRSLLTQTAPVDICLIDDGSSPPVEAPGFAQDRTLILRLTANGGITEALRAGAQFAFDNRYEYICRLDVGDRSYPRRVEAQLEFLQNNPDVDLVGAFARVSDTEGRTLFHHGVRGGRSAVSAYLRKNSPFRHSSFFVRTRALIESGSYRTAFDGAEDYELLLRLSARGAVDCLEETLIDYVVDPKGISESRRARQLRKRLAAQLTHLAPLDPAAYAGVLRTLVVMITPRALAQKATLRTWRRRSA
jgi:glycosyltransferase involved in cell wall biosynthesis